MMISSGEVPRIAATSAMVLPTYWRNSGFLNSLIKIPSGPDM